MKRDAVYHDKRRVRCADPTGAGRIRVRGGRWAHLPLPPRLRRALGSGV